MFLAPILLLVVSNQGWGLLRDIHTPSGFHLSRAVPQPTCWASLQSNIDDDVDHLPPSTAAPNNVPNDTYHLHFLSIVLGEINERIPEHWDRLYGRRTFLWALEKLSLNGEEIEKGRSTRAERVLQHMLAASSERTDLTPDRLTYNLVFKSLARAQQNRTNKWSRRHTAPGDAVYRILNEWHALYDQGSVKEYADAFSYNTAMTILGRVGQLDRLEKVYEEMKTRFDCTKDPTLQPDEYTYNALISAYARQGETEQVEAIFHSMKVAGFSPSIHTYNSVTNSYASSKHPRLALHFLDWWKSNQSGGPDPDADSYNIALSALSTYAERHEAEKLFNAMAGSRNSISYLTYLRFLCRRLPASEALKATDVVLYEALNDPTTRVDDEFVRSAIICISNINDTTIPIVAEKLITAAENLGMSHTSRLYESLLHCWAKSRNRLGGTRAIEILDQVEASPAMKITQRMVASTIDALARRNHESILQAEDLLGRLASNGFKPNSVVYTNFIKCYCQSTIPDKAIKAREVLRVMGPMATIVTYNTVLKTCEYTDPENGKATEALQIACEVFDLVRQSKNIEPSHFTYAHFIGCIDNLVQEDDTKRGTIKRVFNNCCQAGLFSHVVLKKLKAGLDHETYCELFAGRQIKEAPREWTRNVHIRKARDEH